jgi:hypothetical protein
VDEGLVTSRKPDDIPAFCREMIRGFGKGRFGGEESHLRPGTGRKTRGEHRDGPQNEARG